MIFLLVLIINKLYNFFRYINTSEFNDSVDIFITCYKENENIIIKTIDNSLNINYKNKFIYVCDDGNNINIKNYCDKITNAYQINNLKYISRENNDHYKAGNLNNVLKQSYGKYIIVLDADMIPNNNIVHDLYKYFTNNNSTYINPSIFSQIP